MARHAPGSDSARLDVSIDQAVPNPSDPNGRPLLQYIRAAGKFRIELIDDASHASGLRLKWTEQSEWSGWAQLSECAYVLRSNVSDWTADELWRTYIQLTDVEAAFPTQKSDLRIRPIWHQRDDRVEGHILVCFLAYALWRTLEGWQTRAGLGNSPKMLLTETRKVSYVDVMLPLTTGREMRIRCVARPDEDQAMLLHRLALRLPSRLRCPTGLAET